MSRTMTTTFLAAALLAAHATSQDAAPAPSPQAPAAAPRPAVVPTVAAPNPAGNGEPITLAVQQVPLGQVLEMISVKQQVNIVAGVDTTVPVTANFYDATLEQALDWVVQPLGFAWSFDGKVYQIMPAATYDLIQRPLVHHVFHPNYVSVQELQKFLTQFLSPQGRMVAGDPSEVGIPSGADDAGGMTSTQAETLIVIDNQQAVDSMIAMVRELDQRPRQVLVEATILEVKLDETNKFGVDFNIIDGEQFEDFNILGDPQHVYNTTTAGVTPPGTSTAGQSGFTDSGDGLRIGYVGSNVAVFLEALQTVADTNVLANTKVLALNKQRGELIIGGRLGYFGGTTVSDGISQQTVEFLEVGTQLRFRPFIGNDGFVRLEIHPQRSSGVVDPTTGLPTEQTSEVTTNIMVRDGETVMIGGLIETKDVNETSRVPILGYLPGVGWLFSKEKTSTVRSEIIVMLTPHIMEDGDTSKADAGEYADASRAGTRQMRKNAGPVERVEQAYRQLQDARDALARGDLDEARLLCDRSLLLDPMGDGALDLSREIDARMADGSGPGG
jgi:type IV pilus assembly protein PilQ